MDLSAPMRDWLPVAWYGGYLPGLPDLAVGRLPPAFGREWKIWIVETPQERQRLLDALGRPVPMVGAAVDFRSGPDAAVSSPGRGEQVLALYAPPEPDWPWITVGRFDPRIGAQIGLARGVYSTETDISESAALDRMEKLAKSGGIRHVVGPSRHRDN